jgi:hypothetical protein
MFSFDSRKKSLEVQRRVQHLADLTTPNLGCSTSHERAEDRCNRTLPVLLCPWENGRPVEEFCTFALTKDISSRGVGLILVQPFRAAEVVVGFWLDDDSMQHPWYFLGSTQRLHKVGGGYWTLGIEFSEFVEPARSKELACLAAKAQQLRPASSVAVP